MHMAFNIKLSLIPEIWMELSSEDGSLPYNILTTTHQNKTWFSLATTRQDAQHWSMD